jgi:hypothetical protein
MNTVYKAVVTLSASQHYTFSGVPANAFSYSGASSVANSVNNGTVTITFPRTAGTVSAANLAAYLANLPSNTSSTPYTVAVASDTLAGIKDAVRNSGKYVHLDLSACSVTTIGEGAFGWCRSLASVTFAGSNTSIGLDVFPEGYYDEGGNSLKNAYLAANPRSGTYTRAAPSGSTWTKQ